MQVCMRHGILARGMERRPARPPHIVEARKSLVRKGARMLGAMVRSAGAVFCYAVA